MWKSLVILGLAALGLLIPWQLGYDPAAAAAGSDVTVGWTVVRPGVVPVGQSATLETRVQARVATVAAIEATARDSRGVLVWQYQWPAQAFRPWQNQTYTTRWSVPAGLPAGAYTMTIRALPATAAAPPAAGAATRPAPVAASRSVGFRVAAPAPVPPTATSAPPTATTVAPTATVAPPTATAAPPTATAAPPTATPAPPTATPDSTTRRYPFTVTGSAAFAAKLDDELELIRTSAPDTYAMILEQTTEIAQIDSGTWSAPSGRKIAMSLPWMGSRYYAASLLVHEATHIQSFWSDKPWRGCDGEAISLTAQATFLSRINQPGLTSYARGLIGTWC